MKFRSILHSFLLHANNSFVNCTAIGTQAAQHALLLLLPLLQMCLFLHWTWIRWMRAVADNNNHYTAFCLHANNYVSRIPATPRQTHAHQQLMQCTQRPVFQIRLIQKRYAIQSRCLWRVAHKSIVNFICVPFQFDPSYCCYALYLLKCPLSEWSDRILWQFNSTGM